jgi:hypothetical protein
MKTTEQLLADITALTGDQTKLAAGVTLQTDLVTASNAVANLTAERDAARADVVKLTGDKAKLAEGATLPTDLVAAANSIANLTKQLADANAKVAGLEAAKQTVEQAVAAKLVELGVTDKGGKKDEKAKDGGEKLTLTQKALKAKGHDINAKVDLGAGVLGQHKEATEE